MAHCLDREGHHIVHVTMPLPEHLIHGLTTLKHPIAGVARKDARSQTHGKAQILETPDLVNASDSI